MADVTSLKDHPLIKKVQEHLRITKVVCTRSIKGRGGDNYVGFSAAWDTIQDDAGGAADLLPTMGEGEVRLSQAQIGMTFKEARLAACILGLQADTAAHNHAAASGNITQEQRDAAVAAINSNFSRMIVAELGVDTAGEAKNGNG